MAIRKLFEGLLPAGLFSGFRAITTQGYVEANVKNGVQFSASTYFTGLTAGETIDVIVITGDKPVAIKSQYVASKDAGDIISDWYRGPTYTGGTNISSGIFNQSDINPQPTTVSLIGVLPTNAAAGDYSPNDATKPTVTNVGTKIQPTLATLGVSGQGVSVQSRSTVIGLEHNLAPNTVYLYRRLFIAATSSHFGFSTWYEGGLDLPL